MSIINRNYLTRNYFGMLQYKTKHDICWFFRVVSTHIDMMNVEELQENMRMWRALAVQGKIKIMDYNSKTKKIFDKEWYILVVQKYENGEQVFQDYDPVGTMLMNYIVSGHIYAFKRKSNRDDVARYVMKGLDIGEKLMCCLCDDEIDGFGNNPSPLKDDGRCCDKCNTEKVIPARIMEASKK